MVKPTQSLGAILDGSTLRLEKSLFKDRATDIIRENIVKGKIAPGSKLIERELAEVLGISRMPIHDALIQLEKEGIVVSKADARYVIELTERDIRELYRVRLALEQVAAELAAQNTSPANRLALASKLEEMKKAVADQDYSIYTQSDVDMHSLVWHQSGNHHLESILQAMIGPIFMFVANNAERFDWNETLQLHTNLVSCINAGDAVAAVESITRHLDNALNRSLKIFQNQT